MGGKHLVFSDYELTIAKKQTKREKFLSEMEVVVPWQALIDLIDPHHPKASKKGSRPPHPLATMLRVHLLKHWYSLSDPAMEEALIEVPTMRRFAGIELISDRIPSIGQGTQLFREQPPCLTTMTTAIHKDACPRPFVWTQPSRHGLRASFVLPAVARPTTCVS
jgi:IS5 family transposase